ncbi:hypothetical protein SYJ56_08010 [Algoriphagus sp. D3-2-R+10]|uniref:hypothetical protein n=1 Tax=Algoriphagus aurantiacus TaxID=3103948 RepID=UPI002B3ED61E|nr:hypothetical protein [Algoriphagus sp. D3-2-R+10]MEB2775249.1 hypothetical protein [Algoriphagus sp. D3-2-R+10]
MKKIFEYIKNFIQKWIGVSFDFLKDNSGVAVNVTNKIKEIVESPLADIVTGIIPSDVDDKIKDRLRVIIPVVVDKLAILHGIVSVNEKNSDSIALIIEHLKLMNKDLRIDFWIRFAGELNIALSDGELSLSEGISLTQIIYAEKKVSIAA